MTDLKWWATPLNVGARSDLKYLDQYFAGERGFRRAEPISVRFRGVLVQEDEDWWRFNDNDLMIVSTFQFGVEPPVQRLHFLKRGVPLGWHEDFFNDVVLSVREFPSKTLTIRIQVYDVDMIDKDLIEGIQDASSKVTSSVAIAFPQIAPYAGAVGFAVPAFMNLIDNLVDHDRILDQRIKLEIADPSSAFKLLQPGYFVCFKHPVAAGLKLNRDLRVINPDGSAFTDFSYAVLCVTRDYDGQDDWEINQKIAKLLAELNGKGKSGKAALRFLRETMEGYQKFKLLERAVSLRSRTNLSSREETLLAELEANRALAPFLASGKK